MQVAAALMLLHHIAFFEPEAKPKQFISQPTQKRRVCEHKLTGKTDFIACAPSFGTQLLPTGLAADPSDQNPVCFDRKGSKQCYRPEEMSAWCVIFVHKLLVCASSILAK